MLIKLCRFSNIVHTDVKTTALSSVTATCVEFIVQDITHHLSTTATASTSNNTDGKYIDDDDVHNTTGWEHILIESLSDIYIPTYSDNNNTNTSDGLQQEANKKFAYFMITPFAPAVATELMSSLLTMNTTTTTVKSSSTLSSTPSIVIFILQCFCRYVYMYCMYLYILN